MRRGLQLILLLAALTTPVAQAKVAIGEGCDAGQRRLGDGVTAYAAYANGRVHAYDRPGGRRMHAFPRVNQNRAQTVFGVLGVLRGRDCAPAWYRVQLPIRPNGATGFVAAERVTVDPVGTRIEIDLSQRRLSLFRSGRLVFETKVGVGRPETPTPVGRYYVNQRIRALDASGPFGPGAIGISAFSPVLTDWAQGGPVAVHGTNDPSSVGRAASHGCIRVENGVLRRLFRATRTGSPVFIHA